LYSASPAGVRSRHSAPLYVLPLFLLYFLTISARQIIAESTGQIFAPDFQDRWNSTADEQSEISVSIP